MTINAKKLFPEVENIELLNHQNVTKKDLLHLGNVLLTEFKEMVTGNTKQEEWLKSSEVRRLLKISPGTLQTLRINGTIKYSKVGGTIFYNFADIQKMLNQ